MESEPLTLKPITSPTLNCRIYNNKFISHLKMNCTFFKTCEECRFKSRKQGQKFRNDYKQFITNLK